MRGPVHPCRRKMRRLDFLSLAVLVLCASIIVVGGVGELRTLGCSAGAVCRPGVVAPAAECCRGECLSAFAGLLDLLACEDFREAFGK